MFSLATKKISSNAAQTLLPKTTLTTKGGFLSLNAVVGNNFARFYSYDRSSRDSRSLGRKREDWNPRVGERISFSQKRTAPTDRVVEELIEIFDIGDAKEQNDMTKYSAAIVDVKGTNLPTPIESFADLNLHPLLAENITKAGYSSPVPVQKHSLAILNSGRDLMSCSQTGSGKTAAYLLPIINKLMHNPVRRSNNPVASPRAIILAPTRELAQQVHAEVVKFTRGSKVTSAVVFGGSPMIGQMKLLSNGADIIVGTTGRFVDLRNRGLINVENIQFIVLDEADRMLDIGFGPQIDDIIKDPAMPVETRQTMLFSATYPKEIQDLGKTFLKPDHIFLTIGKIGAATETITQKFVYTNEGEKFTQVQQLLTGGDLGRTLIFAKTKRRVDELYYSLRASGVKITSIHGDHSQAQRNASLRAFLKNEAQVLVATDVAARGLDIRDIQTVVNMDLPGSIDDYVHRIGRTGRAGKTGTSISMFTVEDTSLAKDLHEILSEAKQEVPSWLEAMIKKQSYYSASRSSRGGNQQRSNYQSNRSFGDRYNNNNNRDSRNSFDNNKRSSFRSNNNNNNYGDNDRYGSKSSFGNRSYGSR